MGRRNKKNQESHVVPVGPVKFNLTGAPEGQLVSVVEAKPKPVPTPVVPTCVSCRWAKPDRLDAAFGGSEVRSHLTCTYDPPVFVGLTYDKQTQLAHVKGFAYPKVQPTSVCAQHEIKD